MGLSKSRGVDRGQDFRQSAANLAGVDEVRCLVEEAVLGDRLIARVHRPGEHELPVPRQGLTLQDGHVEHLGAADPDDLAEGPQQ